MRDLLIACLAGVALAGCTSSGGSIPGPSGAIAHQAKCSGSPDGCMKKAAADCKGPYQVLDSSSNAGGVLADVMPGPVTWYRMSYQCGPSDGRMPSFPFRGSQYRPAPVIVNQTSPAPMNRPVTCSSVNAPAGHVSVRCY